MQYDERANGKTIQLQLNAEFQIVLPETRTAGYRWSVIHKGEPICELLEERSEVGSAVGGSGTHVWRFRSTSSGTATIQFEYGRSWNAEPEKNFVMEVQVRP